ncbi:TraB/GumN family protein [Haloarculaceae archaeon H-GB2-1]|nr:TraB/GumN family protein [Haloarculaceae archaeon H-GB1-1]MEA5409000.1 TraB/GumN family protein [Haloarculaceae archaeon H-GB2-1]
MTERVDSAAGPPPEPSGEGSVAVVGTAHVSSESVEEVERTIEDERPDMVAVELDEGRYRQLKGEAPDELDASDLLQGNTVFQFLAYWMLSYVQTRLGDRFDIQPGADMLAAVETAEGLGLGVALVDRDIQQTIQRFWRRLSGLEKLKLAGGLALGVADGVTIGLTVGTMIGFFVAFLAQAVGGPYVVPAGALFANSGIPLLPSAGGALVWLADLLIVGLGVGLPLGAILALALSTVDDGVQADELDMSELTDADVVTAMMEEFRRFSPGGAEALIDERDAFIAHRLVALREAGYSVVAVVGAGHRAGIERYLEHPEELPPMDSLVGQEDGSRFSIYKAIGYAITLGFLAFFVLLALGGAQQAWLVELFAWWFVVNGLLAGGLAKLGGARWLSALVGGGIAWMTSVNPLLAPGWFAGYVELRYLDVDVGDISTMNEILGDETAPIADIFARLRAVPLFRLILVVALTNIGSMLASLVVFPALLPMISAPIGGVGEISQLLLEGARNGWDIVVGALL